MADELEPAALKSRRDVASSLIAPIWDQGLRELRVGDRIVKRFKVPAANQELILDAFHEEGWPRCIDDPLPPKFDHDSKTRLHEAIDRLNRNQKNRVIRLPNETQISIRYGFRGADSRSCAG